MSVRRVKRLVGTVLSTAALLAGLSAFPATASGQQPPEPPEGFVAAGDLPAKEELPAAPFVSAHMRWRGSWCSDICGRSGSASAGSSANWRT